MRPRLALVMALIESATMLVGCAATGSHVAMRDHAALPVPQALDILAVRADPKTLTEPGTHAVTISYALAQPATVHVDLVDDAGRVIRQLGDAAQPAGAHQVQWDGHTDQGQPAPGGVYRYVIHAKDHSGRESIHDPSSEAGGEELTPREFTFDAASGVFQWTMPKAGFARLRVGIEGFPYLRALMDWQPLEAGAQRLTWDGLDASGLVKLSAHPHLEIKLVAFAMPQNAIIVHSATDTAQRDSSPSYPTLQQSHGHFHARHARATCHEVRVHLTFPDAPVDARGRSVLTGVVPVRVTVDPRDASYLINQRYEVALFEDLTALFEEEESMNPFTYLWDTTRVTPGEHLLTVNVLSYDDHFGVETIPVVVQRAS